MVRKLVISLLFLLCLWVENYIIYIRIQNLIEFPSQTYINRPSSFEKRLDKNCINWQSECKNVNLHWATYRIYNVQTVLYKFWKSQLGISVNINITTQLKAQRGFSSRFTPGAPKEKLYGELPPQKVIDNIVSFRPSNFPKIILKGIVCV